MQQTTIFPPCVRSHRHVQTIDLAHISRTIPELWNNGPLYAKQFSYPTGRVGNEDFRPGMPSAFEQHTRRLRGPAEGCVVEILMAFMPRIRLCRVAEYHLLNASVPKTINSILKCDPYDERANLRSRFSPIRLSSQWAWTCSSSFRTTRESNSGRLPLSVIHAFLVFPGTDWS